MGTPWKIKLTIHAPTGSRADIEAQITESTKNTIMAALDAEFKGEPMNANALLRQALEALHGLIQFTDALYDRGPEGGGWKSVELLSAIDNARAAIKAMGQGGAP